MPRTKQRTPALRDEVLRVAMAILAEFKSTRPLAVLLSGDGKPYADLKLTKAEKDEVKAEKEQAQLPA